jgi:CO dehydrogenase/acetyl-CoA synthase alpha subunit
MRRFLLLSLLFLAGCTVIIGTYSPDKQPIIKGCDKFIAPALPAVPDVPVIPKELLNNKDASENILIDNISELREYIKRVKSEYQKAAEQQLKSCQ